LENYQVNLKERVMKKLKSEIREWIFNGLLELLFKFSNSHKLVKFNRLIKGDKIYYELSLRATIQIEGSLRDIEEKTSEYLKNLTLKNIELDEEQDEVRESKFNFMIPGWKNEGFWPKQAREKVEAFSVRNGYQTEEERVERLKKRSDISSSGLGIPCHINNQAKFPKLQKLENSSSEPGFNFLSTDLATTHQENPLLRKSEIKHVNFAEGEVRDKIIESYKDLQVKTMKRAINENGYEILNEVKNGFIIARKDRHNIQPEGYLENLTKDLSESDKWIREQASIPSLSKQDLKNLGVTEQDRIELSMDSYGKITCTNKEEIEKKLKDALKESGATVQYTDLPDGSKMAAITSPGKGTTLINFKGLDSLTSLTSFNQLMEEKEEEITEEHWKWLASEEDSYNEYIKNLEEDNLKQDFTEEEMKVFKESNPKISVEELAELSALKDSVTEEEWNKQLGSLIRSKKQIIDTTNLPIKRNLKEDFETRQMQSFPTSQEGIDKIPQVKKLSFKEKMDMLKGFKKDNLE
jgi:hypothetical protein